MTKKGKKYNGGACLNTGRYTEKPCNGGGVAKTTLPVIGDTEKHKGRGLVKTLIVTGRRTEKHNDGGVVKTLPVASRSIRREI